MPPTISGPRPDTFRRFKIGVTPLVCALASALVAVAAPPGSIESGHPVSQTLRGMPLTIIDHPLDKGLLTPEQLAAPNPCDGPATATFSANVAGGDAPLTFAWFVNGLPMGGNAPNLILPNDPLLDGASVWCVVTDNSGVQVQTAMATFRVGQNTAADMDADCDADVGDFGIFAQCFGGPEMPPSPICPPGADADYDNDGDVDNGDFALFAACFGGANTVPNAACGL